MLNLEEARKIQKQEERKAIVIFLTFTLIIAIVSYLIFVYTDILTQSSLYYLIPVVALLVVSKISGVPDFFTTKEFVGIVIKNEIFSAEEKKVKRGGFDALQDKNLVSELLVKNEKGRTIQKTFYNGPITSNLIEGDKIAILRFIDTPIVIEGKHWK